MALFVQQLADHPECSLIHAAFLTHTHTHTQTHSSSPDAHPFMHSSSRLNAGLLLCVCMNLYGLRLLSILSFVIWLFMFFLFLHFGLSVFELKDWTEQRAIPLFTHFHLFFYPYSFPPKLFKCWEIKYCILYFSNNILWFEGSNLYFLCVLFKPKFFVCAIVWLAHCVSVALFVLHLESIWE